MRAFRVLLGLLTFVLAGSAGFGQSATDQTLLWKIDGNGLSQASFFLITTSITCEAKVAISDKIGAALRKVKAIRIETGATSKDNGAALQRLFRLHNAGQSASKMLSPGVHAQLAQKAKDMGVDEIYLDQYTLFYIYTRLLGLCADCALHSVDRIEDELRDYGKKNNVPVGELLSTEEAIGLYNGYPGAYWNKTISYLLDNSDKVRGMLNAKAVFYKQENYAGLKEVCDGPAFAGARFAFTANETSRMLLLFTRIEETIKAQPTMMTIDASEVANDPTSIFTLLKDAGYSVTPVFD